MQTILMAIVAGMIIGPLARLALPGRQNISLLMTVVLGAVGALAGSAIFSALSNRNDTGGIDWMAFFIGIVVAAIAILVYTTMTRRQRPTA